MLGELHDLGDTGHGEPHIRERLVEGRHAAFHRPVARRRLVERDLPPRLDALVGVARPRPGAARDGAPRERCPSAVADAPERRADLVHHDLRHVRARESVRQRGRHRLEPVRAPAQNELRVEEPAAFERLRALRDHRLQPAALVVGELPRPAEGDVQRATHPGRGAKRHRHPALVVEIPPTSNPAISARVSAQTGSPAAIARANGTFESSANVPQCRSSPSE